MINFRSMPIAAFEGSTSLIGFTLRRSCQQSSSFTYQCRIKANNSSSGMQVSREVGGKLRPAQTKHKQGAQYACIDSRRAAGG